MSNTSKRHNIEDIVELIKQIKHIDYPPSGKLYVFKDGENHIITCEDWNLGSTIERKLVEIDQFKKDD